MCKRLASRPSEGRFFFQAEDGIRHLYVTGVQTCALPIWSPLLLDPFFGGRPIGERELLTRYRSFLGSDAPALPPDALATADTPGILTRMLRNLLRVYLDQKDHAHALAAAELLLVLVPDSADELRVRGLLYEHLECFGAALGDFRRYLELAPEAPDAELIRESVARLVRIAAAIH